MKDTAHILADKRLKRFEKELIGIYKQALKEIEKEIRKKSDKFLMSENPSIRDVNKYLDRLDSLFKKLTVELSNADKKAISILKNDLKEIGIENLDFAQEMINKQLKDVGVDLTYTLFNNETLKNIIQGSVFTNLAIDEFTDKAFIYNSLKREFATAMLKGESVSKIANRIQNILKTNKDRAILIARTEVTRVENEGRYSVFENAKKEGIKLKKKWIATMDSRTRKSHSGIDGEVRDLDDVFSNGCEFPGDPRGGAAEVCNCRCSFVAVLEGYDEQK